MQYNVTDIKVFSCNHTIKEIKSFYGFHLVYYFIVATIGGVIICLGLKHPVYNTETAEIITPYSKPFIVFGIILIILSFIGMIYFCGDREED